jgi:hypothetical protein
VQLLREALLMTPDSTLETDNRRSIERRGCRGAIQWSFFNHRERFNGVIVNYSEAGAAIESSQKMKPGSNILLHTGRVMIACERMDGCLPPHATLLAEIKWVKSHDEGKDTRRFSAGIRYHL